MNIVKPIVGAFRAATEFVCGKVFEGAKAFASLIGINPALHLIVGKIRHFVQIAADAPHKGYGDIPHPLLGCEPA